MNNFRDDFTTEEIIAADKNGKEKSKTKLTNDAFALGMIISELKNTIEHAVVSLKK